MGLFADLRHEIAYIRNVLRTLNAIKSISASSENLVVDDLEAAVKAHGDNIAIRDETTVWTYKEYDARAEAYAHWALAQGLKPGDTVAVFMQNRADFVACWVGLAKVGVISALLNNQLVGHALSHCLNISEADHIIVDAELAEAFAGARGLVERPMRVWSLFGVLDETEDLERALAEQPREPVGRAHRAGLTAKAIVLKMFTSGTTGMPKAAKIGHTRAQNYMRAFPAAAKVTAEDKMFMTLPLFHATGGLCGVGCALTRGGELIIRRRFSASKFWEDAAATHATLFMYVGEMCRFLANAPEHANDRDHHIRCGIGNGLRPDVWARFQERFAVPEIIEFYGATEGNVGLLNIGGPVGAIGRVPSYLRHRFNVRLVVFDQESEAPVRGADGFCQETASGEVGEAIGEIREDDARFRFDGYADKAATEKKILRSVFKEGDIWFRTGDLMRRDDKGYFYFVDRVGDTFRWKSENVATSEVAEALGVFDHVHQANVYGVPVPGYDGKAGMASLVVDQAINLKALFEHVSTELPPFARPVFLRLHEEFETTGTFKYRKMDLVADGFDPDKVQEPLYVADPQAGTFVPLDAAKRQAILDGELRL